MTREQIRCDGDQAEQRRNDGCESPSDVRHGPVQRPFAERARVGATEQRRDELPIDSFLEYVRADRESDRDQRENTQIG